MKSNGAAIRAIRTAQGRGLRLMAERTGFNRGYLSRLETGETGASEETLRSIADWLGVSVEAISHPEPVVLIQATPDNLRQITDMLNAPTEACA